MADPVRSLGSGIVRSGARANVAVHHRFPPGNQRTGVRPHDRIPRFIVRVLGPVLNHGVLLSVGSGGRADPDTDVHVPFSPRRHSPDRAARHAECRTFVSGDSAPVAPPTIALRARSLRPPAHRMRRSVDSPSVPQASATAAAAIACCARALRSGSTTTPVSTTSRTNRGSPNQHAAVIHHITSRVWRSRYSRKARCRGSGKQHSTGSGDAESPGIEKRSTRTCPTLRPSDRIHSPTILDMSSLSVVAGQVEAPVAVAPLRTASMCGVCSHTDAIAMRW